MPFLSEQVFTNVVLNPFSMTYYFKQMIDKFKSLKYDALMQRYSKDLTGEIAQNVTQRVQSRIKMQFVLSYLFMVPLK